jgi:hypothetical protein
MRCDRRAGFGIRPSRGSTEHTLRGPLRAHRWQDTDHGLPLLHVSGCPERLAVCPVLAERDHPLQTHELEEQRMHGEHRGGLDHRCCCRNYQGLQGCIRTLTVQHEDWTASGS